MLNITEIKRQLPDEELISFGYMSVKTPAPGRIYSPGDPITREMIMDYYEKMSEFILPYLLKRPLYVKRNLTYDETFFLRDESPDYPDILKHIKGSTAREKGMETVLCNNVESFLYLTRRGMTEINIWHSIINSLDYPDYLVIDLDPSEHNSFAQVKELQKLLNRYSIKRVPKVFAKHQAVAVYIF